MATGTNNLIGFERVCAVAGVVRKNLSVRIFGNKKPNSE
jgi:hypothetical protein